MRTTIAVALLSLIVAVSTDAALARPRAKIRLCGNATVNLGHGFEGAAVGIRAVRVSCRRARKVAGICVRYGAVTGWDALREEDDDASTDFTDYRVVLERGRARVSFRLAGGGSCRS